jgi:hypothetical protein
MNTWASPHLKRQGVVQRYQPFAVTRDKAATPPLYPPLYNEGVYRGG